MHAIIQVSTKVLNMVNDKETSNSIIEIGRACRTYSVIEVVILSILAKTNPKLNAIIIIFMKKIKSDKSDKYN